MASIGWKSAVSGNWTLGSNWDSGTVPASGDDVTIGIAGTYTVTLTASISVNSITLSDSQAALSIANPSGTETVAGTFSNAGTLSIDTVGGQGGSSLAIGGTLSSSGVVSIGNTSLAAPTTVTATGLINTGTINLSSSSTKLATLNIQGPAPATLGNINILGDALLEFASGAVSGIAAGTTFSLRNDVTAISLNASGVTTGTFSNAGTLDVDNQSPTNSLGDGGSSLAIGATLANSGTVNIGNAGSFGDSGLSAPTTVTATGLINTGTINLSSSSTKLATLNIQGPAPATLGNINILGDALLEFASGAVSGIAAGTTFSLRNDVTAISLNASGVTTGTFSNAGTLDVDNQSPTNSLGDGGSSLAIGATLANSGTVNIGNAGSFGDSGLSAPTTVTATGLINTGTINLSSSSTKLATLNIQGPAPATLGNINILGDALLEFASGAVSGIAAGTTFSLRNDVTAISLNASGVTTGTFSNAGTLDVDNQSPTNSLGDGGSSLAIGATLANSGTVNIGNAGSFGDSGLSAPTTVTATGLINTGTINLSSSSTKLATLNIQGPAPATLGNINILGDALLEFASGAVSGIAAGTTFSLRNDVTAISLNASGVTTGTFSNAGTLDVDNQSPTNSLGDGGSSLAIGATLANSGTVNIGNAGSFGDSGLSAPTTVTATGLINTGTINLSSSSTKLATLNIQGPAPATLGNINILGDALLEFASGAVGGIAAGTTFSLRNDVTAISLNASGVTTGTFSNAGTLDVDNQSPTNSLGDGGSSLAIGATLANSGTVNIGNAGSFGDSGLSAPTTVTATGLINTGTINLSSSSTKLATLNIQGPAPATLGNINILGDALLEFASGAVGGIAAGTTFSLRNDVTAISLNASGVTTGTFSNAGTLDVDNQSPTNSLGDGGSSLAIGATLANSGTVNIGNAGSFGDSGLSAPTTVTATGLINTGTINLSSSSTKLATLNIQGPAPATLGNINILGDALLEFASGAVGGIAAGTTFSLRNDVTAISLNASGVTTGTFSNAGTLDVDNQSPTNSLGDGGSSLAIGATLANSGTVNIGNAGSFGDSGLSAPTTVTATGLINTGTINLSSSSTKLATLNFTGPGTPGIAAGSNTGRITSNADGIAINGAARLVNGSSGSSAGVISAGNVGVDLSGGSTLVNFGTITSASGTAVAFGTGGGTVVIEPGAVFKGAIGGLAQSDLIDFAHVSATGFSFAGGALTLFNHGIVVPGATISVTGSFTGADLALVSDGNGGVEVGIAPLGPIIVGTYYTPILLSNPAINNSATVTSTGRVTPSYGDAIIGGAGVPGTVANLGTIAAASPSSVGISLGAGGLVANGTVGFAGGYISGSLAGIKIGGGSATITNLATIRGGSGILIAAGSATVSNAGTIAGTSGTAVSLAGGSNRLILAPGALFQGKADGGGGKSVVEVATSLAGLGMAGAADTAAAVIYVSLGSVTNFSALQVDPGAATDADGDLTFDTLVNQGQINLLAGDSLVIGTVAGAATGGTIDLKSGGSVHFTGAVAASQTVLFRPPGGTVALDHPEQFAAAITQFAATDLIDLPLGAASFQQYAGGVLSLSYGGGTVALNLATIYATPQFQFTGDGHGGTDIFVSAGVCFCRGTLILTDRGEVPVEKLAVGERVRTLSGAVKPIVWIGIGHDLVTRANRLAKPVIVRQDALADGVPHCDLYLTHGHALYLDGVLIPVENLINHRSILWDETARVVEFFHIELEDHDVVLANGAPAESYYDASNRAQFHNTRPGSIAGGALPTIAPVLNGGPVVERAWTTLFERSGGRIASDTTDDPDLHLVVNHRRVEPTAIEDGSYSFTLAGPPADGMLICSRNSVPSLVGITAHDHRQLGVALARIVISQPGVATVIEHDAPALLAGGCHPPEGGYSWTDGELTLPPHLFAHLSGPFTVAVKIERPGMRYPLPTRIRAAA